MTLEQIIIQWGFGAGVVWILVTKVPDLVDKWLVTSHARKEQTLSILSKTLDDRKEDRAQITELGEQQEENYSSLNESIKGLHDKVNIDLETHVTIIRLIEDVITNTNRILTLVQKLSNERNSL